MILRTIIWLSVAIVNLAFAGTSPVANDNSAFLMWIIGGLCTLLFTIGAYTLAKVDRNQDRLFQRQDMLGERVAKVEARCEVNHD